MVSGWLARTIRMALARDHPAGAGGRSAELKANAPYGQANILAHVQ